MIYIVDQSPIPIKLPDHYLFGKLHIILNKNIGFGGGHNIVLNLVSKTSDFHFILNPDVYFEPNMLAQMVMRIENDSKVGLLIPKVLSPDGSLQFSCRLLPSPLNLFIRRFHFLFSKSVLNRMNNRYELRDAKYDEEMNPPVLSGCFLLLRMSIGDTINFFDQRFFMYLEDVDFCRRVHSISETLYYPKAIVYHEHAKSSFKNTGMLVHHVASAIKYFNKWGWFFDNDRNKLNNNFLKNWSIREK